MLYTAVGALLIGVSLGLFGSGGSILTVPVLVYLLGHEEKTAIAESLLIVGCIAAFGALQYAAARTVAWRTALLFAVPGIIGTVFGAWIASFVPGVVQLLALACIMLFAAWMMWRRSTTTDRTATTPAPPQRAANPMIILLVGVGVGIVTGFVGVGGGFLIVPALVLFARIDIRKAIGTSLLVIAINAAAGYLRHAHFLAETGREINPRTVAAFIGVGIAGSLIGRRLNTRMDQTRLQQGFSIFLAVMGLMMVVSEIVALTR
ncbi:MAG: sulfite exporter TauE/SafE family protein [Phycisphaeraceae bacterium]|nr:MAG: sulfite exporter TauE/SafE family protein [Phycisphaeraceae bacterium]